MGARASYALPFSDLRHASGDAFKQRACGSARGRAPQLALLQPDAMGGIGEPSVREAGHFIGDLDLAALSRVSRHAARYEGRGGSAFFEWDQSARRPRMAVLAAGGRASGMALLRSGRIQ